MSEPSFRQTALSGARWTLAGRVGLQLITWPITILNMRLLDPRDYGIFALALIVMGFIALFSELGLGVALVQRETIDDDMAGTASGLILVLNSAVAAALFVLAPWAAKWFDEPELTSVMRVLTLELLFVGLAAVPQAMLERQMRFRSLAIAQMAGGSCGAAGTLIGALLGFGVWALVLGNLANALIRSGLLIMFHGRFVWPRPSLGLGPLGPLVRFSGHVVGARALWYWYGQADQIILGRLLQASLLGHYNVASQLAMLPVSKAMEAVNRVAFPIFSRVRGDPFALQGMHQRLIGMLSMYAFGICWGLAAVAEEFVALVLGAKWHLAASVLGMLALVAPLRMLCAFHNTTATAVGVPQAATKELAVASLAVPAAVLAGAWFAGLNGAALGWVLIFPFVYLLSTHLTCSALGLRLIDGLRPVAVPVLAGLAMLVAVWSVKATVGTRYGVPALLALEIVAGTIAYSAVLVLLARERVTEAGALLLDLVRPKRPQS